MGKNFWKKSILAGCMIACSLLCTNIADKKCEPSYAYVNVLRGESTITIANNNLKKRICSLLGKGINDNLYANDFMENDNYKPTTTTNEETGVSTTTANRCYLDLSNAGLSDISELAYFQFPETLVAIDLSGNNLTKDNLTQLQNLLNLEEESIITYNEVEITSKSNFKDNIKKVNLSFNKIDLENVDTTTLSNTKLLFGFQNLEIDTSGLVLKNDLANVKYYIRTEDILYLTYNVFWNGARYNYTENAITNFNNYPCGLFKIEIANLPSTATGYFYGLQSTTTFTMYDIYIKSDFKVERKNLFNLKVDPTSPKGMDIIIEGLDDDVKIRYTDPQTNIIGTSYVNLIVEYNDEIFPVSLPFTVVDTTAPTITLKGYEKMYWKQNKSWVDPGYLGLDSGDDLTQRVDVNLGGLDTTVCGSYTITYSLRDLAGNSVTATRTVVVQEEVLDEIIITSNKSNYSINDEIILTVQPASNSPLSNYKDYKYSWYIDGVFFKDSTGDSATGKSSITLILDKSIGSKVTVKLNAKQKIDGSSVNVDSAVFELTPNLQLSDNTSIIIACAIAVIIIVVVIIIMYYLKAKNSKQKISGKKKGGKNTTQEKSQEIQVIKDYNGSTSTHDKKDNSDK